MLQEYLRNQEESTKKMERRIDFIHESLGNKSEVLFKQVIKLDEDIKKLREDHDRSLTLVKLDVASKYQELLNKSMRIEDTSYGNSKHLGSIYNRLQALEGSSHANYKRERSPTPNHPPFYCNAITRRSTTQVHEDNEEEEREYEEQLNDEDEEQSIDINASPKQSMDTPSPRDPRFSPRSQASTLPRWKQCKDHHHLLKKKILGMKTKKRYTNFQEGSISPCPSWSQSTTITTIITTTQWYVNSISREKLAEFNQFVQTLPASMSFKQAWRHYPFTTFFHNCKETPEDIKSFLRKLKFSHLQDPLQD
ncbi:unnamed protein product [Microthlaspi erraticum]|uniref:Uncharacterized protein n=1 Tax=Microthlaspi erraticum TaxID=1685480 RepID=A0A6D2JVN6_9BRAS|nr:unnamed protein product [Microthlaspi erraticum]